MRVPPISWTSQSEFSLAPARAFHSPAGAAVFTMIQRRYAPNGRKTDQQGTAQGYHRQHRDGDKGAVRERQIQAVPCHHEPLSPLHRLIKLVMRIGRAFVLLAHVVKKHKKYYYKEWQVSCTKMKERKLDVYFNI